VLWAGGTILSHPFWQCVIVCLCRASDIDRAPKFYKALAALNAKGFIGDLDDGPGQIPLEDSVVKEAILKLLPRQHFDIIITHSPAGEYTSHIRHNEVGRAVINLWIQNIIPAEELWTFAYEDGGKKYLPRAIKTSSSYRRLARRIKVKKHKIIIEIYGFRKDSFEARTTPGAESFRQFTDPQKAGEWLDNIEKKI